ncbi:hypothetical protein I317_07277 [Kwoniella heveanensis CBS 569]|uniref:NmrA-like domain-containing protein n=1 Tax=Kwoniella heveanensis BCC8398 TaxID=1296120 RepID=A0A1B9GXX8_9TREE|nr:hypothetical protein I316_02362 [Kwoniella heveanensis BCC8398]OCF38940.1 hypothetical protein I317_07277 [Kwoniella heveanensis CBS 569]
MSDKRTILVITATGKQGGAAIKAIDQTKFKILAAVRDASSDTAKSLGVDLVQGELDQPDSLFQNEPIYGLFLNLGSPNPVEQKQHGIALIDAAVKYRVKHVVFSSLDFCGNETTGASFLDVKREVEAHLKAQSSLRWTILRPVGFMENFYWPLYLNQVTTTWKDSAAAGKHPTHKLIAVEDIGKVAAEVFADPEQYYGKEVGIAGDELRPDEIVEIWKKVTGQTLQAKETPVFPPGIDIAFQYFIDNGFETDVQAAKKDFPFLQSFESWLKKTPFAHAA